jgi:hypothetical protein
MDAEVLDKLAACLRQPPAAREARGTRVVLALPQTTMGP